MLLTFDSTQLTFVNLAAAAFSVGCAPGEEGARYTVGNGSDIVPLIDDLVRAFSPDTGGEPEDLWTLVLKLESSLRADRSQSEEDQYLMARVKAAASFVLEAQRDGGNPPHDDALAPLTALRTQVTARTGGEGGPPG